MKSWLLVLPLALLACATSQNSDPTAADKPAATGKSTRHLPIDGHAVFGDLSHKAAMKKGGKLARECFNKGDFQVLTLGLPGPENAEEAAYKERLKTRYGVVVSRAAGCELTDGILGGTQGFNATMSGLLKKRFGTDVFEEARKAAP
jgi:hypothetical protein